MPRPRKPYLNKATSRHGKTVWYVRIGEGKHRRRVRLRSPFGTPEFEAEYQAAIAGKAPVTASRKPSSGTLEWAAALYRQSSTWQAMAPATRRGRENILKRVVAKAGAERLADITRADIIQGREDRAATPAAARNFVDTMRGLFRWAVESDIVSADPTAGIKTPKKTGPGFAMWTEEEIAAFQAHWPVGTRERVAFDLLLYTGLRRGDAVVIGRPHVRDGVIRLTTEKTGERVAIVISPELAATLAAGPCGDLTFIAGERGRPMVKESFGTWFREACRAVGIKKSAHGLRKAAATRAAMNGATESELEAMFGWRGGAMASLYTRAMNRERIAIGAGKKLESGTAMGAPENPRGRTLKKSQ